ncbi:uncharacterized protein B0H18DRAFT_886914 [Fomitopsis serialis]|uniref:uncharacterized protein n=1 Tax=Fomitopsis serialis TaxID=139415 RepID=UPI0020072BEC|nr:uncharacterized protein B0H18DRAFT_886914 [Neoantrodia serialis]KAH9914541.1 hypothetical protein B0H18DRAFT_886914 [Neoantrodia serialis]
MAFNLYRAESTKISKHISVHTQQGQIEYRLAGIIYFGGFHFTCRIISADNHIWCNDGRDMGSRCESQGTLKAMETHMLKTMGNRNVSVAIYVRIDDQ